MVTFGKLVSEKRLLVFIAQDAKITGVKVQINWNIRENTGYFSLTDINFFYIIHI